MGFGCHPANLPTVTAISHADALAAIKKAEKPAEQGDNIFLLARNGSASVLEANRGGYKLHEKTRLPPCGRWSLRTSAGNNALRLIHDAGTWQQGLPK